MWNFGCGNLRLFQAWNFDSLEGWQRYHNFHKPVWGAWESNRSVLLCCSTFIIFHIRNRVRILWPGTTGSGRDTEDRWTVPWRWYPQPWPVGRIAPSRWVWWWGSERTENTGGGWFRWMFVFPAVQIGKMENIGQQQLSSGWAWNILDMIGYDWKWKNMMPNSVELQLRYHELWVIFRSRILLPSESSGTSWELFSVCWI